MAQALLCLFLKSNSTHKVLILKTNNYFNS